MGSTVSVDAGAGPNLSSTANRQTGVRSGKRDRRIVAAAGPTHGSVSRCLAGPMFKPGTLCPCDQTYPIDKVPGGVDLSGVFVACGSIWRPPNQAGVPVGDVAVLETQFRAHRGGRLLSHDARRASRSGSTINTLSRPILIQPRSAKFDSAFETVSRVTPANWPSSI